MCAPGVAAASVGEHEGAVARGDFDGDGEDEIVVSSPQDDCGRGVIHIRSGPNVTSWTRNTGGVLGVAACNQYFGTSLAVGDFDNDGYDDLAVSAPGASDTGDTRSGAVHLFYGSSSGLSTVGDQLWNQDTVGVKGVAEPYDYMGDTLEVGDFDCDGYDDLVVGVPREDLSAGADAGAVHVLYGSSGGVSTVDDWWHEGIAGVNGAVEPGDNFGGALAGGNFNGDEASGYACDDLAIASPGESVGSLAEAGFLYIMDGSPSGLSTSGDQAFHQNTPGVAGVAEAFDGFGERLEVIDDNDDAYDDLVVSVPGDACSAGHGEGRQVMHGGLSGIRVGDDEIGCNDYRCSIRGSSYQCESFARPIHGRALSEDFELLVGDDLLWAGDGDDLALGDLGDDVIFGGDGDDILRGGPNADIVIGGLGDDTFEIALDCEAVAGEIIDGGPGSDTVLSHLSQTRLDELGVTLRSIENFVYQPEETEGDCEPRPNKLHPSDVVSVNLNENFFSKDDTVILSIATRRSDLTAWADFSVVDSNYSVGDEAFLGGGSTQLELRYRLSGNSTVKPGNLRLPIELRDASGRLVHRFGIALRYAPEGVPALVPEGGTFQLAEPPSRPDNGWRVQSAQFITNAPPPPTVPQFDFSTTLTTPAAPRTLEVTLRAPQAAALSGLVEMEVGEKNRDGRFAVVGEVESGCVPVAGTTDCDYTIDVGFAAATGEAVLQPLNIQILDAAGGISPSTELFLQAEGIDPFWARAHGRVQVEYLRQDVDTSTPGYPNLYQEQSISFMETFSLPEGAQVRLNLCGQTATAPVDINGEFSLGFWTNCVGENDGFLEVFSSTGGAATNRIAIGSWIGTPSNIDNKSSLTDDPDDYAVYVVRVANGLRVDDATSPGGLDLGVMTIQEQWYPDAAGALVGLRGIVDAIKYGTGIDGVSLTDLPSINVLANSNVCLESGGDSCNSFGGEQLPGIHPGFFYVQNWNLSREAVYAHEWGHVFHGVLLKAERYNEFREPYATLLAQNALEFAGRAEDAWQFPLGSGGNAENMDFNGKSDPDGGQTAQVVFRPFFTGTTAAAAVASDFGCDEPDEPGGPAPSTQSMGNCVMAQSQGGVWRVYWDLHDGSASDEPVSVFVDDEGTVTTSNPGFDQVDGGGNAGGPSGHVLHAQILEYFSKDAANSTDRGQSNLDLVDVLDAMTCGGMSQSEAGDLLGTVHKYQYDFDPLPGMCD